MESGPRGSCSAFLLFSSILLDRAQPDSAPLFWDTGFRAACAAAALGVVHFLQTSVFVWQQGALFEMINQGFTVTGSQRFCGSNHY